MTLTLTPEHRGSASVVLPSEHRTITDHRRGYGPLNQVALVPEAVPEPSSPWPGVLAVLCSGACVASLVAWVVL